MSLSATGGPLADEPDGQLNAELDRSQPLLYLQPMAYRIRGFFENEVVVDSTAPFLLHETGRLPVYLFAADDVRCELLASSAREDDDGPKGARQLFDLCVGERTQLDAAWSYVAPPPEASFLDGLLELDWDAMDEWFCEDEQLHGHPRDPFSRIDVYRTTRHLRVLLQGELLAETRRALALYETGLPPRYYVPPDDVRTDLLVPSSSRSRCAYKGSASYWHVRIGDELVDDLVWSYPEPQHDAEPVRDLLCFFNERVDLELEGESQERPTTQWSRSSHGRATTRP